MMDIVIPFQISVYICAAIWLLKKSFGKVKCPFKDGKLNPDDYVHVGDLCVHKKIVEKSKEE